jgi:ketosteroid isomerase-like protein
MAWRRPNAPAVVMPPDAPSVKGHAAIREFLTRDVAESKAAGITIKDVSSEIGISADFAWHCGKFAVLDAAGKTVGTGKFSEVWQKTNGKWLLFRDMWNNDAPAPAAAPAK